MACQQEAAIQVLGVHNVSSDTLLRRNAHEKRTQLSFRHTLFVAQVSILEAEIEDMRTEMAEEARPGWL